MKLWVSFEPNPQFGDGFERGKTVSVSQAVREPLRSALPVCVVERKI